MLLLQGDLQAAQKLKLLFKKNAPRWCFTCGGEPSSRPVLDPGGMRYPILHSGWVCSLLAGTWIYGSHALRGNPVRDAPAFRTAERFRLHSHAERGNDESKFQEVIADHILNLSRPVLDPVPDSPFGLGVLIVGRYPGRVRR